MLNFFIFSGYIISDINFISKNDLPNAYYDFANFTVRISSGSKNDNDKFSKYFTIKVICKNKLANFMFRNGKRGMKVEGRGYLKNSYWKDENGEDRYCTDVVAEELYIVRSGFNKGPGEDKGEASKSMDRSPAIPDKTVFPKWGG